MELKEVLVFILQVLATTAKNLILLDLGMTIAFPTIVIPTLLDGKDPSGLTFNTAQASWFGELHKKILISKMCFFFFQAVRRFY